MFFSKRFGIASSGLSTMAFTLMALAQAITLHGAVIPSTVVEDNLIHFHVTWSGILDDGSNNTLVLPSPVLTNWAIGPDPILLTYVGGGNGWTGSVTGQHIMPPHPPGDDPTGDIMTFNFAFSNTVSSTTNLSGWVSHPSIGHTDYYTLTYSYTTGTNAFTAELTGTHVPEPASFAIFCLGTFGALARAKAKRKKYC
jgi:hypothetical protein